MQTPCVSAIDTHRSKASERTLNLNVGFGVGYSAKTSLLQLNQIHVRFASDYMKIAIFSQKQMVVYACVVSSVPLLQLQH